MKKIFLFLSILLLISGCSSDESRTTAQENSSKPAEQSKKMETAKTDNAVIDPNNFEDLTSQYSQAIIKTNVGDVKLKFYDDTKLTANNFLNLAKLGFYDGTKFHRVIKGFMIQGGDPNSKDDDWSNDGIGGPGFTVKAEIKHENKRGTIATARQGDQVNPEKESSGSQFFINTVDNKFLNGGYTVFGEVVSGMDVVDKIENVATNGNDHPTEDMTIQSIELLK